MGQLTLLQIRTELQSILGVRAGVSDARLDQWINFGYSDIVGVVSFEELDSIESLTLTANIAPIPATVRVVVGVISATSLLTYRPIHEWTRLAMDETGKKWKWWTRVGTEILLAPTTASGAVTAITKLKLVPLADDADKTVIPETWDLGVLMFAVSYAFAALDEHDLSVVWYNRALAFAQGRAAEERREILRPGTGGTVRPDALRLGIEHGAVQA